MTENHQVQQQADFNWKSKPQHHWRFQINFKNHKKWLQITVSNEFIWNFTQHCKPSEALKGCS